MDFSLTDTQAGLKELSARIFSEQANQERLRQVDDHGYHDDALWRQLAESGLLGITLEEAEGGVGENFETLCVLLEEAGRTVAPLPLLEVLVSGCYVLQSLATKHESVRQALASVAGGVAVLVAALDEPGGHSPLPPHSTARQHDGGWRLSGVKHLVAAAQQPGHGWTLARTDTGLGLFLFDLHAPGVSRERQISTTGEYLYRLELNEVPAECLLVDAQAQALVESMQLHGMAASAAIAVGVCTEMTRLAAEYTSERVQFGKPLATFQAVSHRLADCHIDNETLRGLMQQAVSLLTQHGVSAESREAALAAKIFAAEALHRVSHATQQVHGGTGVDRDYPLFRYCLLAKKLELAFGGQAELTQRLGRLLVS